MLRTFHSSQPDRTQPFRYLGRERPRLCAIAVLLLFATVPVHGQLEVPSEVVIIGGDDDPRIAIVHAAVAYWSNVFATLDLKPALGPITVRSPSDVRSLRGLETYARQISQRAGHRTPSSVSPDDEVTAESSGPKIPMELESLREPILVFLSDQNLMPFAWPLSAPSTDSNASPDPSNRHPRLLLGVPRLESEEGDEATTLLIIVAHELGHALGLSHRAGTDTLMCMPCDRPSAHTTRPTGSAEAAALPLLTAADEARLRGLYGQR